MYAVFEKQIASTADRAHFKVWTSAGKPEKRDAKMQIICIFIYLFHPVFSNAEKF
jgi:hypothetical protein